MLSVGDDGKRMGYDAAMELQTQIDELKASSKRQKIAIIALAGFTVFFAVKPHGEITCDGWRVNDKDGNQRITAGTTADGYAGVQWFDIATKSTVNGNKFATVRIEAWTNADGEARVQWRDRDGKTRIVATTFADGTVELPTEDLKK